MLDLSSNSTRLFSSIDIYPFGFIFDYNKNYKDDRFLDITEFAKFSYDEKATIEMVLPIYKRNTPFPLNFRTKDDIANTTKTKNNFKVRQVDGNADK